MHLGKGYLLPPLAHMVDVHQFRGQRRIPAFQDLGQGVGGIRTGEAGNAALHGMPVQQRIVAHRGILHGPCIDDVAQMPAVHEVQDLTAFAGVLHAVHGYAHVGDGQRGSAGGVQGQTQVMEALCKGNDFLVIVLFHGDEHTGIGPEPRHGEPGGRKSLEHGLGQGLAHAQHFAGGLHFRTEDGIGIRQLFKGEDRHFHGHIRRRAVQAGAVAEGGQGFAQHDMRGQVHHGHAGDLGNIGHGAAGPGIDLDDIEFPAVDQVLDVHQSLGAQSQGELFRGIADALQVPVMQVVGRIDGDGIAGMHAGALDMLHDAGNQDIAAVGNDVHFQLNAGHVLVHEHRVFNAACENALHIGAGVFPGADNGHVLSADDIGGPQKHGIAQRLRSLQGFVHGAHGQALGTRDMEALQKPVELFPVLSHVNAFGAGAEDGHMVLMQVGGQMNGGLSAEGHHHADGLLHFQNGRHILRGQGLEIETVSRVIVRGHGLGIVVDNDHVIAHVPQRPDAVHRGIVKLNALSNADRAGAQHQHHGLSGAPERPGLADTVAAGIEIGRSGVKLGAAGIHHLVAVVEGHGQVLSAQAPDGGIRESQMLGLHVYVRAERAGGERVLHVDQVLNLVEEEPVHHGQGMNVVHAHAAAQGFIDGEQPVVILVHEPLGGGPAVQGRALQGVQPDLRAADGLHQRFLKALTDGHDFARGLHLGAEPAAGAGKLVKRPLGELHHHIVYCGLKAGAGDAGDIIGDLAQVIPQRQTRGDLGNGIARGLGGQGGGTRNPGVHLNDGVLEGFGMQRELAVAPAHNIQRGDHAQRGGTQHLVFLVGQGQGRGHHNGVTGVHAHGIHVFHGAHGNHIAQVVAHGFKLDFLPAGNALFHQDLMNGGKVQTVARDLQKLFRGFADTAAGAAQGIGRAHNDGIPDVLRRLHGGVQVRGDF